MRVVYMEINGKLNEIEDSILKKIVKNGLSTVSQNELYFLIYKRLREIPLAMEEVEEESDMLPPPPSVDEFEDLDEEDYEKSDGDY